MTQPTLSYNSWMEFLASVQIDTERKIVHLDEKSLGYLCLEHVPKRLTKRDGIWELDGKPLSITPQQKSILDVFWGNSCVEERTLAVAIWGDEFKPHKYINDQLQRFSKKVFSGTLYFDYSDGNWFLSEMA